jgi:hypothetical protein
MHLSLCGILESTDRGKAAFPLDTVHAELVLKVART